jgi:DNA (cytosine-5)-methyltransferase 1
MANISSRRLDLLQRHHVTRRGKYVQQTIDIGGRKFVSQIATTAPATAHPDIAWVQSYLAGTPIEGPAPSKTLRAVDLFCASGGLTAGLKHAAQSLGFKVEVALAVDADVDALEIYRTNHGPMLSSSADVQALVNYQVADRGESASWSTSPALIEPHVTGFLGDVDVVVAGPPCQGHSNLNNSTRRKDGRNVLYLTAVAFAVAARAELCIIENVPEVLSDSRDVVRTAKALFLKSGYRIDDSILSANDFGVAQRRRRHFLVAVRDTPLDFRIPDLAHGLRMNPISVKHAIGDLVKEREGDVFNGVGQLSVENIRRIAWLFDNDAYDLPNKQRPDCHKNGHTYPSVYGRMRWNEPAQTLTSGFLTPGRGRFVHPGRRRTLTPHEAARLQSFPDSYAFSLSGGIPSRMLYSKMIGDAVPPLLARAVSLIGLSVLNTPNIRPD